MDSHFVERREFYRVAYEKPLKFRDLPGVAGAEIAKAISQNISQSGILFISKSFPKISSIIWINLPLKELSICREIESSVITIENGVLGRVVRVEELPESKTYAVGVCFVRHGEKESADIIEKLKKNLSLLKGEHHG